MPFFSYKTNDLRITIKSTAVLLIFNTIYIYYFIYDNYFTYDIHIKRIIFGENDVLVTLEQNEYIRQIFYMNIYDDQLVTLSVLTFITFKKQLLVTTVLAVVL